LPNNKPLLSACLIVRDTGNYLQKCLASIKNIVDEIVIVDTGSKDNSVDVARQFTSNIYFFKWIDDMSPARNISLDKANGEWILSIDADEYLQPVSKNYIKEILNEPRVIAYSCKLRYTRGYTAENGNLFLFRNNHGIRFNGIMHESIAASLEKLISSGEYKIGDCDLFFDHSGWDNNVGNKYNRDLKLVQKELEFHPENGMLWNRIALIYHHTGKKELARSTSEKALNLVRKNNEYLPVEANVYALAIQIGYSEPNDVELIVDEALAHYPGNPTFLYTKARLYIGKNEYDQAIDLFRQLLILGETEDFDHSVPHQLNLFNELAYDGIATCFFKMKQYLQASEFYLKALQYNDKKEYRVKSNLCISLAESDKNQCCQ